MTITHVRSQRWFALHLGVSILPAELDWSALGSFDRLRWPVSLVVWALPFLWVTRSPSLARSFARMPLAPLGLWAAWLLVAANWSLSETTSYAFAIGTISLVLAASWFAMTFGWTRFARVMAMSCLFFLAAGVVYRIGAGEVLSEKGRFVGLAHGPTDAGRMAAVMAISGIAGFGWTRLAVPFVGLGLLGCVAADARTAMLGLILGLIVVAYRRVDLAGRVVLVIGTAVLVVLAATVLLVRADGVDVVSQRTSENEVESFTGRTDIWPLAIDGFELDPLLGIGTASSPQYLSDLHEDGAVPWQASNAHNAILHTMLELGVVGLALLVVALVAIAVTERAARPVTITAILVLLFVNGTTEALVHEPGLVVALLAGMAGTLSAMTAPATDAARPVGAEPERTSESMVLA